MAGSDYDLPSLFPAQELKEPYCTFLFLAHFAFIREGFDRVLLLLFSTFSAMPGPPGSNKMVQAAAAVIQVVAVEIMTVDFLL